MAPLALAESWDNVGLLVGDRRTTLSRAMTCLTLSPHVVAEAVQQSADLVIAHHPLPFKPLSKITSDTLTGSMLLDLISGGVAVYSAHTAFDSAAAGINQTWAQRLGLQSIAPLVESDVGSEVENSLGSGRWGELPEPLDVEQLIARASDAKWEQVEAVGECEEYRAEIGDDHGTALVYEDTLVHGSMLAEQCSDAVNCRRTGLWSVV